jgi:hypothetical protein
MAHHSVIIDEDVIVPRGFRLASQPDYDINADIWYLSTNIFAEYESKLKVRENFMDNVENQLYVMTRDSPLDREGYMWFFCEEPLDLSVPMQLKTSKVFRYITENLETLIQKHWEMGHLVKLVEDRPKRTRRPPERYGKFSMPPFDEARRC